MGTDRTGLRPGHPLRTCIGCRGADSRSALLRVVLGPGADGIRVVLPDPEHRRPGRGAWLHPVRRRAFGRALRSSTPPDHTAVDDWFRAHLQGQPSESKNRKRV